MSDASVEEIREKIQSYAEKLTTLDGYDDKRVKKRVLQALGKLKKKLNEIESQSQSTESNGELSLSSSSSQVQPKSSSSSTTLPAANEIKKFTHSQAVMKLKLLNKELAQYAMKKQLKLARKRFNWGRNRGLPLNVHTYANLMNACVRCGKVHDAEELANEMITQYHIQHNPITYTILIKGYANQGEILKAWNLLSCNADDLSHRSLNAFLRGCVRVGAVDAAVKAYQTFTSSTSSSTSTSTAYVVTLLSQCFKTQEAISLCEHAIKSSSNSSTSSSSSTSNSSTGVLEMDKASMYVSITKAFALFGLTAHTSHWLALATAAIEKAKTSHLRDKMYNKIIQNKQQQKDNDNNKQSNNKRKLNHGTNQQSDSDSDNDSVSDIVDGDDDDDDDMIGISNDSDDDHDDEENVMKKANSKNHSKQISNSNNTPNNAPNNNHNNTTAVPTEELSKSMLLFLQHRRAELSNELELIQEHFYGGDSQQSSTAPTVDEKYVTHNNSKSRHHIRNGSNISLAVLPEIKSQTYKLMNILSRTLYFGMNGQSDIFDINNTISANNTTVVMNNKANNNVNSTTTMIAQSLIYALRDKFGLDQIQKCLKHINNDSNNVNSSENDDSSAAVDELIKCIKFWKKSLCMKIIQLFDTQTGYLNLHALFQSLPQHQHQQSQHHQQSSSLLCNIPIKLELGSGSGEWLASQAAADYNIRGSGGRGGNNSNNNTSSMKNNSNSNSNTSGNPAAGGVGVSGLWIGIELKCDRVHDMICQHMFATPPLSLSTSLNSTITPADDEYTHRDGISNNDNELEMINHPSQSSSSSSSVSDSKKKNSIIKSGKNSKYDRIRKSHAYNTATAAAALSNSNSDVSTATTTTTVTNNNSTTPTTLTTATTTGNVAIMGGNAHTILDTYFPSQSVSAVFVNHPEPPEQRQQRSSGSSKNSKSISGDNNNNNTATSNNNNTTGSRDFEPEGMHMLTKECFIKLHRVLKTDGGTITIVTDNLPYAQLLLEILKEMVTDAMKKRDRQRRLKNSSSGDQNINSINTTNNTDASDNINHRRSDKDEDEDDDEELIAFESILSSLTGEDTADDDERVIQQQINLNDLYKKTNNHYNGNHAVRPYKDNDINAAEVSLKRHRAEKKNTNVNDDDDGEVSEDENANETVKIYNKHHHSVMKSNRYIRGDDDFSSSSDSSDNSDDDDDNDRHNRNNNDDLDNNDFKHIQSQKKIKIAASSSLLTSSSTQLKSSSALSTTSSQLILWKLVSSSNNTGGSRGQGGLIEMGHVIESSSYFDRLWKKGEKKKRYVLYLKKLSSF